MGNMKDSGIEWIGMIPSGWDVKRIKYVTKLYTGNSISDDMKELYEDAENAYPYIATKDLDVDNSSINYENGMYTKKNDYSFKIAPQNSTLMCIEGGSAGKKIAKTNQDVSFVNKLCCFDAKDINADYLYMYLKSEAFREEFNQHISGLIGGVSQNELKGFYILLPSEKEQQLIADFLNDKVGGIDDILSDLRKQVETLIKYRSTLIYNATSKGLITNVDYKDIDNEWYQKIPEHWRFMAIKRLTSILTCGVASTPEYVDESEGVLFLSAQNIQNNKLDLSIKKHIPVSLHKSLTKNRKPEKGDILQVRVGATIGKSAIVDIDDEFSVYVSLSHIRTNENMNNKFMNYIIGTDMFREMASLDVDYAGSQGNLNVADLKEIKIPVPPINEQLKIVEYLDDKCAKIDGLIRDKEAQIEKMEKYKKSLIYEYVTGKKRVKGAV